MTTLYDVTGIGNAIVDVFSRTDDATLTRLNMPKGGMKLIDADEASRLYAQMGPATEVSGGSVANSMAGVASFGGRAAYIGKVRNDQLGDVFAHDIRAQGVAFTSAPAAFGPPTARCLVLITPDGQRTMNTYLGACVELGPEDIDEALIAQSAVTYLEGYLWDPPRAKEALLRAAQLAHKHGRKVALSLSDAFCVERHRDELNRLLDDHVDILFANESEALAMTRASSYEAALRGLRGRAEEVVVTRGADGAHVVTADGEAQVGAEKVPSVVDTTGAGDLFAAGYLFARTGGKGLSDALRLGAVAAAEIIGHVGARPALSLASLLPTTR